MRPNQDFFSPRASRLLQSATAIRFVFALAAALIALYIGEKVFLGEYVTTDENSYMFQAWIFLQGKIRLTCPPFPEAFFHRMIICDDQIGWVSRYPPAHILWLLPGVALGHPRLMTAVAAFLSVWFISKAGERLRIPAWCSILLLFISPYFWLMQGSILSHTSSLAALALMTWSYLAWRQEGKIGLASLAGLAWTFLFLSRTYTAFWIAIPFAVDTLWCLWHKRSREQLMGTLVFAASAGLALPLFLLYNYLITGDPLVSTFLYYDPSEGPGFGMAQGKRHTPAIGWSFLKYNFQHLNTNLWGFSGSLLVLLGLVIIGWRKAISPVFVSATILVWISYGAFWFRGIEELPPIYYYETLVFMVLLAGMGLTRLFEAPWPTPEWGKPMVAAILIASVLPFAFSTLQTNAQVVKKRTGFVHRMQKAIHKVPPGSIVVLWSSRPLALEHNTWNSHGLDSDPLVVRDSNGITLLLSSLFPNRPVYVLKGHKPVVPRKMSASELRVRTLYPKFMRANTGAINQSAEPLTKFAESPTHSEGWLGTKSAQALLPGKYQISYFVDAKGAPGTPTGLVDVVDKSSGKTLKLQEIYPGDERLTLNIEVHEPGLVRPRVYFSGTGRLEFKRIEIRKLGPGPASPAALQGILLPLLL